MTTDIPAIALVTAIPDEVIVEHLEGPVRFDLYRPQGPGKHPVVLLVTGFPDPGAVEMFGKPFKDWASYSGWARLFAAAGIAAVTYENRDPADVFALVGHLRADADALGIDTTRLGVWAVSGNVPNALGVIARERPACAALLYGFMLDLDGGTSVAEAAAQLHFAVPKVTLDDLTPGMPLLVVRAGRDTTPGLDATLLRFVSTAKARGFNLTLIDHAEAPHAFDMVDPSDASRDVIAQVVAFVRDHLA